MIPPNIQAIIDSHKDLGNLRRKDCKTMVDYALSLSDVEVLDFMRAQSHSMMSHMGSLSRPLCDRINTLVGGVTDPAVREAADKKAEELRKKVEHERLHEGTGSACPSCPN